MIRVGRIIYENGKPIKPSYPGFEVIEVMLKYSSKWYDLSPYYLKDEQNRILENIWQGSKVYEYVPATTRTVSYYDKTIAWTHPYEKHIDSSGNLTKEYFLWRNKLQNNKYPIRYPVGYEHRKKCKYCLSDDDMTTKLDYIDSRINIYVPLYIKLVKKQPLFNILLDKLEKGTNILIIEVDGPHEDALPYYKQNWNVKDDFIEKSTILATPKNLTIMLNDSKFPFGHGYCLAMALLNLEIE
jgi:hypothetical protein